MQCNMLHQTIGSLEPDIRSYIPRSLATPPACTNMLRVTHLESTYPLHTPYMVVELSHTPFLLPLPHHAETSRVRRFTSCRHVQHYEPRFLFVAFVCDIFVRRSVVPRFSLFVHFSSAAHWAQCPNIIRFFLSIICTRSSSPVMNPNSSL